MIRGYFRPRDGINRPHILGLLRFSADAVQDFRLRTQFRIDTGADRTILGSNDTDALVRSGLILGTLPTGPNSAGVGGRVRTRLIDAVLTLESTEIRLALTLLEPSSTSGTRIPSLLGRDVISRFALFLEERTARVYLLDQGEADALQF